MSKRITLTGARKFLLMALPAVLLTATIQFPESSKAQENVSAKETAVIRDQALKESNTQTVASAANKRSDLTDWKYSRTDKYSSNLKKFTVGSIAITISAVVPWTSVAWATNIANLAYQLNEKNIYYTVKVSYRYIKGTKLPRAEKSVVTVYSDSARTKKIGKSHTKITYSPGW